MTQRYFLVLLTALASVAASAPAWGQSTKPRAAVEVNLKAKLKGAQGNPQQLASMLKAGAKVASFCANCHGDGGNSVKPDVPNLAGQNESYLFDQMQNYSDGHRPTTEFKRRLINYLNVDEEVSLVAFYARQEVTIHPPADPAQATRGRLLYKKFCADCHENDGKGSEDYGRVAGQQPVYMMTALKSYRGNPTPRFSKDMVASLKEMKDDDLNALVAYIASMK